MRQKILLSAALLHNPSVLLLDEPLTGLDADACVLIKDLLITLSSQGKTILCSSHVLDVVEKVASMESRSGFDTGSYVSVRRLNPDFCPHIPDHRPRGGADAHGYAASLTGARPRAPQA